MTSTNEIVVAWSDGQIKSLVENGGWEQFNERQKALWLREMNKENNLLTRVRLVPQRELAELFFHRVIPSYRGDGASGSATYMAGKWVKLTNFQEVYAEAVRFN